jgi:hypothetical protein
MRFRSKTPKVLFAALSSLVGLIAPWACSSSGKAPLVVVEPTVHPPVQVTMNGNDIGGSGTNTKETFLNVTNVNTNQFGKLFSVAVDGDQYAQPLYMGGVKMSDGKTHNVVFVATEHDSVYAFDADDDKGSPLWQVSLGESIPLPNPWFGAITSPKDTCSSQNYNMRETGITGTPVIDAATKTLYAVALNEDDAHRLAARTCLYTDPSDKNYCTTYTCNPPAITYRLHALDLTSGKERAGSPVTIAGEAAGTGWNSVNGEIAFDALPALQRTSLLLDYGTLYFATASYADLGKYHGWIFAYDAATLMQKAVLNDTPNGTQGGIWMSGRHMLSDHHGYVYVVTGNGTFDSNDGGADHGDSVLKLDANTLKVVDWFSPFLSDFDGFNFLDYFDDDLGAAGATLIPNTTLLLASGKQGKGYVVDTADMGHWKPMSDAVVQRLRLAWPYEKTSCATPGTSYVYGTPPIWEGPDGTHVYVWGSVDYLRDYVLDNNGLFKTQGVCFCPPGWTVNDGTNTFAVDASDPPCGVVSTQSPDYVAGVGNAGGVVSVSSNGKEVGTGIVWATRPFVDTSAPVVDQSLYRTNSGYLEAFDATDLSSPIWTSAVNAARDSLGNWAKYTPPTIANGKVYMATQSKQLVVYGLLPAP